MGKFRALLLIAFLICSCDITKPESASSYDDVFILYSAGYNNLSGSLVQDINYELASAELPDKRSKKAIVVFSHASGYSQWGDTYYSDNDYVTPTEPVLIRLYEKKGKAVLDTIKRYETSFDEVDPQCLKTVLNDIKRMFPSKGYGMLYSSHGFGWLPAENTIDTKAIGARYSGKGSILQKQTDIRDFVTALPMHFEYILLDACYMGAVEVAYQMRSCCDWIVASATEIPAEGFDYAQIPHHLFSPAEPDLEQICRDYIAGSSLGGTIALVNCSKLEALASGVASLVSKYGDGIAAAGGQGRKNVQRYWLRNQYKYFYDLRDIFNAAGADASDMAALDALLGAAVPYEDHTETFDAGLNVKLERCCGLSMYLPYNTSDSKEINSYYGTLDFCKATNLVR